VKETLELAKRLREEHAIALASLVVNQVPEAPLDPSLEDARRALEVRARDAADRDLQADLALLERAERARAQALLAISPLHALGLLRVLLPHLDRDPTISDLESLGALLLGAEEDRR
jgi:hypothetical protein